MLTPGFQSADFARLRLARFGVHVDSRPENQSAVSSHFASPRGLSILTLPVSARRCCGAIDMRIHLLQAL